VRGTLFASLVVFLVAGAAGVAVVVSSDALWAFPVGGGTALAGVMFAALNLLYGSGLPPGADGEDLPDVEPRGRACWQGQAEGASRWLAWDLPVIWFMGVAVATVTELLVRAIELREPEYAVAWLLVVPLIGVLLWQRYQLLVRRPNAVVVQSGRVVVGGRLLENDCRETDVDPHHVLLRHRDGAITVAFGVLTAMGRMIIRFQVAAPVSWRIVRHLYPGVTIVLMRVSDGAGFERALREA
jgi:hypothetical protein